MPDRDPTLTVMEKKLFFWEFLKKRLDCVFITT
jgi:hypothetical protein